MNAIHLNSRCSAKFTFGFVEQRRIKTTTCILASKSKYGGCSPHKSGPLVLIVSDGEEGGVGVPRNCNCSMLHRPVSDQRNAWSTKHALSSNEQLVRSLIITRDVTHTALIRHKFMAVHATVINT